MNILNEQQADKEIAEYRAAVRDLKDRFDRTNSISPENPFVTSLGIEITGMPSWMLRSDARDYAVAQANLGQALIDKAASLDHRRGLPYIKEAEALFREALRLLDQEHYPDEWRATQAFLGSTSECLASFRSEGASFSDAIVAYRAAMDLSKAANDHDAVAVLQTRIENCEQMLKASGHFGSSGQGAERQS